MNTVAFNEMYPGTTSVKATSLKMILEIASRKEDPILYLRTGYLKAKRSHDVQRLAHQRLFHVAALTFEANAKKARISLLQLPLTILTQEQEDRMCEAADDETAKLAAHDY